MGGEFPSKTFGAGGSAGGMGLRSDGLLEIRLLMGAQVTTVRPDRSVGKRKVVMTLHSLRCLWDGILAD